MADLAITLADGVPDPVAVYLCERLSELGFTLELLASNLVSITMPTDLLEAHATEMELERPLKADAVLKWSEQDFRVRAFVKERRNDYDNAFSPAERAAVAMDFMDKRLLCDEASRWQAALTASGMSDAAEKPDKAWLIGSGDGWANQPLLGALSSLGYLESVAPLRNPRQHSSVGLPPVASGGAAAWRAWLKRAARGEVVSVEGIRSGWGEGAAFYFAWQTFYLQTLRLPACAGLLVYLNRPEGVTVDDDPYAALFSLLAVAWAIFFVTKWRSREAELAFSWGTVSAARNEKLRPSYVGEEIVDPVTGMKRLHERGAVRWIRYALSATLTLASLAVPVGVMLISLNLQGYIVASTGAWMGIPVHLPAVAAFAAPGALFDPLQADSLILPLVPVAMHAIAIQLLNAAFRGVAEALTELENHRTQSAFAASMLIKRFAFEAADCYLALFYIAFELRDVPKLRAELIALFTADTAVEAETALEPYEDFDDFLEMVIQFGYITLFASAFPLAPAICVVANSIEIVADTFKLAYLCRRPRPTRAASIGGWSLCCYTLMLCSIYTNIFIMGVASDQMAAVFPSMFEVPKAATAHGAANLPLRLLRMIGIGRKPAVDHGEHEMRAGMGRYIVLLMVGLEHALLLLLLLSELLVSRPPRWVRLVQARREHERATGGGGPAGGGSAGSSTSRVKI